MLKRPVTSDDLARLRDERDEADRRYNEALTALDRALPRLEARRHRGRRALTTARSRPSTSAGRFSDRRRCRPPAGCGRGWRISSGAWSARSSSGSRRSTRRWSITSTATSRPPRAPQQVADATAQVLAAHAAALAAFQSHLIVYLQQVTAYVDTKDRLVAGSLMSVYDAALNGLTDELLKRWESLSAREARFDGKVAATTSALRRPARDAGHRAAEHADDQARAGARVDRRPTPGAGAGVAATRPRQLQVRRLRGPLPRIADRHPRQARVLRAAVCRRPRRARRRVRSRRAAGPAATGRRAGTRPRAQSRDGRDLPRPRPRGRRGRPALVPAGAARWLARAA